MFLTNKIALFNCNENFPNENSNPMAGMYQTYVKVPFSKIFGNLNVKQIFFLSSTEGSTNLSGATHLTYTSSSVGYDSSNFTIICKSLVKDRFTDTVIRFFGCVEFY